MVAKSKKICTQHEQGEYNQQLKGIMKQHYVEEMREDMGLESR